MIPFFVSGSRLTNTFGFWLTYNPMKRAHKWSKELPGIGLNGVDVVVVLRNLPLELPAMMMMEDEKGWMTRPHRRRPLNFQHGDGQADRFNVVWPSTGAKRSVNWWCQQTPINLLVSTNQSTHPSRQPKRTNKSTSVHSKPNRTHPFNTSKWYF